MAKEITLEEILSSDKVEGKIKDLTFEQGLKLLSELVNSVEGGSQPLERSIASYERGVMLVEQLRKQLSGAEEKLKVLKKSSEKGFSVTERDDV